VQSSAVRSAASGQAAAEMTRSGGSTSRLNSQSPRCPISPCRLEGSSHGRSPGRSEVDPGCAARSPSTLYDGETIRVGLNELPLLCRREENHTPSGLGIAERRENLAGYSKIRMTHMGSLPHVWETQGNATKLR
jgi:hypothetical protein